MSTTHPKAFISHAAVDKERFVTAFAERLRSNGVDAWLDEWAMQPGDSLVDRIFEQGIGEADVFIIVLSEAAVASKWVREELNAAVVRRIEGQCRLIPVVLEGSSVPEVLKSTLYQKIDDVQNYDAEFDRVLRAIFAAPAVPPLGVPPSFAYALPVPGLTGSDGVVLEELARLAIQSGSRLAGGHELQERFAHGGLSREAMAEGVLSLKHHGYAEDVDVRGQEVLRLSISWLGLLVFIQASRPDIREAQKRLIASLVNGTDGRRDLQTLASEVGVEPLVAETLLMPYEDRGLLRIARFLGGASLVHSISPLLGRELA